MLYNVVFNFATQFMSVMRNRQALLLRHARKIPDSLMTPHRYICMKSKFLLWPFAAILLTLLSACGTTTEAPSAAVVPETPSDSTEPVVDSDPDGYVLGRGDVIGIQVFDEPDLTLDATVSSSGNINYSYLGDVQVGGKTPLELERHISGLLENGFLVNPSVNVSVIQFRPFFIGGEVRSPGSYPYQPGLTMDKAIALAGGLTDRASTRRMFLVKSGGDASDPDKVNLGSTVAPGDTISIREGFF